MMTQRLLNHLGIELPIIQAPMAGVATPALAAAVSNAGALGGLGLAGATVDEARAMIDDLRAQTGKPFNVNFFCNSEPRRDPEREAAWLAFLAPLFAEFGATPPGSLASPPPNLLGNQAMVEMLLETRPPVISFHFGLPPAATIEALHETGAFLMASATNLEEAGAIEAARLDAVIAQGIEAGGHRGFFDPDRPDERFTTLTLTRLLARELSIPVIAAGGIMDGAGIAACLTLGAAAAQLGTAFIACPETSASERYRRDLLGPAASRTAHTTAISGRAARGIVNRFMCDINRPGAPPPPDFPLASAAYNALTLAALNAGNDEYGSRWAGQGAMLARALPATELVRVLAAELSTAQPAYRAPAERHLQP